MVCPSCNQPTDSVKSVIARGLILTGCDKCLPTLVKGTDLAAAGHRRHDQRKYAQDLVQPFEKDFAKLYGADNAREYGWTDEDLRKYG